MVQDGKKRDGERVREDQVVKPSKRRGASLFRGSGMRDPSTTWEDIAAAWPARGLVLPDRKRKRVAPRPCMSDVACLMFVGEPPSPSLVRVVRRRRGLAGSLGTVAPRGPRGARRPTTPGECGGDRAPARRGRRLSSAVGCAVARRPLRPQR